MPGTPHQFKAKTDSVIMLYCYSDAVPKDKEKNYINAYFDTSAEDQFTVCPKIEDLACDHTLRDNINLAPYPFSGPNNEIRASRKKDLYFQLGSPRKMRQDLGRGPI